MSLLVKLRVTNVFGGVVPEVASRHHVEVITACIEEALAEAGITENDVTAVAVTYGPGLVGALLVGLSAAKAFCLGAWTATNSR